MSFMVALVGIFTPIRVLSKINSIVQAGLAGMERTFDLLDRPEKIFDSLEALPLRLNHGAIAFRDVDFAYNQETPIFSGLTIEIPGGSCCALVGLSGAGKSTLLSMLPRFIDPTPGQVLIDGQGHQRSELGDAGIQGHPAAGAVRGHHLRFAR